MPVLKEKDGGKSWWIDGKLLTEEGFNKWVIETLEKAIYEA